MVGEWEGGAIALRQFSLHCLSQYNFLVSCSLSPHFEHVRSDTKCKHDTPQYTKPHSERVFVCVGERTYSFMLRTPTIRKPAKRAKENNNKPQLRKLESQQIARAGERKREWNCNQRLHNWNKKATGALQIPR